jgi:hypothetical protein
MGDRLPLRLYANKPVAGNHCRKMRNLPLADGCARGVVRLVEIAIRASSRAWIGFDLSGTKVNGFAVKDVELKRVAVSLVNDHHLIAPEFSRKVGHGSWPDD